MRAGNWTQPAVAVSLILLMPIVAGAATVVLNVPQLWQHKDTTMPCVANPGPCGPVAHAVNHASTGCLHCAYYCAPGSPYWIGGAPLQDPRDVFYADYDPVPNDTDTWTAVKRLFR